MANRTHKKRPRDPNQLGKMIVDISVGEVEDRAPTPADEGKDEAAVRRGQLGGAKGGPVRAARLSKVRRIECPRSGALRLPAKPLEPAGKPRLIVSSRKIINLLASDQGTTQPLQQDERLHHRIHEAITVPPLRAGLLKNATPIWLA